MNSELRTQNSGCEYHCEYHCECKDNYVKNNAGVCVDLCHEDVTPCGNLFCDENIVEGQATCLMEDYSIKDKENGVLVCGDYGLAGGCYILHDNFRASNFKSLKVLNNWEVFIREYDQNLSVWGLPFEYIDNSNEVYNFIGERYLTIQPKDYETFELYYGSLKPYVEIKTHSFREVFREKGVFDRGIRGFTITSVSTNLGLKVIALPTYIDITDLSEENNEVLLTDKIKILDSYEDISDGLVVCNIDSCQGFKTHGYYYNHNHFSTNWPVTTSNSSSSIIEDTDVIYLHEGWEALACKYANSPLSDCKKITSGTHESWSAITGGFTPRLLIVQPSTKEKLKEITGDNYTILYSEPNYQGNSIAFYKKGERLPNPIKQIRSILNKGKVNTYLNKKRIEDVDYNKEGIDTDNYIHTTDSTSWKFDKNVFNYDGTPNLNSFWNTIFLSQKIESIKNEGVKITLKFDINGNINYCSSFLQNKILFNKTIIFDFSNNLYHCDYFRTLGEINYNDITTFEIKNDWEAFVCRDYLKSDCQYFSEGHKLIELKNFLNGESIKYILVQPKNHLKMNQFYGHKEYNEQHGIDALEGYVILYKNTEFKDCITDSLGNEDCNQKEIVLGKEGKSIKIGEDTIINPNEVVAIQVVGGFSVHVDGFHINYALCDDIDEFCDPIVSYSSLIKDKYYDSGNTLVGVNNLMFKKMVPSITLIKSLANAQGFNIGMYKESPNYMNISALSSNNDHNKFYKKLRIPTTGSLIDEVREDSNQNKDLDNSDLLVISGHGAWGSSSASQQISGGEDGNWVPGGGSDPNPDIFFYHYSEKEGQSLGDNETDWIIISACNSLGKSGTSETKVMNSYSNHFKNGIHGIGGMYKRSFWPCWAVDNCDDLADDFWDYIKDKKSMAFSYLVALGDEGHITSGRNAGYIAPGLCKKGDGEYSYVHNDHFWGYGNTLPDPNSKFIKENGYCYTSYWSHCDFHIWGWYYTCSGGRPKDFTDVNPEGDWDILTGKDANDQIINSITSYFNGSNNINDSGRNGISYLSDDFGQNYILVDGDDSEYGFEIDQKVIDSYYQEAEIFYDTVFKSIVSQYNYEISSVTTSFVSSQHFNDEGVKDSKVYLSEIVFNLELTYKGHFSFNNNNIKIGINVSTGNITFIKSKLIAVEKTGERLKNSDIDNYINSLDKNTDDRYVKSYLWNEDGVLRPIVYSINYETTDIKILKTF